MIDRRLPSRVQPEIAWGQSRELISMDIAVDSVMIGQLANEQIHWETMLLPVKEVFLEQHIAAFNSSIMVLSAVFTRRGKAVESLTSLTASAIETRKVRGAGTGEVSGQNRFPSPFARITTTEVDMTIRSRT